MTDDELRIAAANLATAAFGEITASIKREADDAKPFNALAARFAAHNAEAERRKAAGVRVQANPNAFDERQFKLLGDAAAVMATVVKSQTTQINTLTERLKSALGLMAEMSDAIGAAAARVEATRIEAAARAEQELPLRQYGAGR